MNLYYMLNDITIIEGLSVTVVAMGVVFTILLILMFSLMLFKHLGRIEIKSLEPEVNKVGMRENIVKQNVNKLDLNDENMVVASLIATIEASNEYGCELRVVNIREVN